MALIQILLLGLVFNSVASQCPKIIPQKPFDLNKYLGLWYEIYRTDMPFQVGTKCVNASYTANSDGTVGVWNQAINGAGQYTDIRGKARVKNSAEPAALAVTFENPNQAGDYNVLVSKYDEYSLVYSCRSVPNTSTKFEVMWILSRTKTLSSAVINQLRQILINMGADTSKLAATPQNC